jgi:hypothetical protein
MKKISFLAVFLFVGCASVAANFRDVLPLLAARTLIVSETKPGALEYPYEVCAHRGLFGGCKETEKGVEYFDLNDPAVASKLRDMNFQCRVKVIK